VKAGIFSDFCVAPIVASLQQTNVVFWAAAQGCCDPESRRIWCWNQLDHVDNGGTKEISASQLLFPLSYDAEQARFESCKVLAASTNATATWQQLCSLPVVFLNVESIPAEEAIALKLRNGILFSSSVLIIWPIFNLPLSLAFLMAKLKIAIRNYQLRQ
jgi:hypothetical protein